MTRRSWRRRRWNCEPGQQGHPLQHRHRPGHHAQRAGLCRSGCQRRREDRARGAGGAAGDGARRGAGAAAAAVLPLSAAPGRAGRRRPVAALGGRSRRLGRHDGARTRRHHADPAGVERQELAVPPRRRSPRPDPAGRRAGRGRARLAAGGLAALSGAPARGLEPCAPGRALRAPVGHGDDAGLVRPGRARADRRGRAPGRLRPGHAAGGAAGRALQLDPEQPGRLAQDGQAGRRDPGGRRGWRHQRLLADRGARDRGQSGADPHRGGRPHPAGRRQHGPGAGAHRRAPARRRGQDARRLADARADPGLPRRQGGAAVRPGRARAAAGGAQPRIQADRRLDPHRAEPRGRDRGHPGRLLPEGGGGGAPGAAPAHRPAAAGPALCA